MKIGTNFVIFLLFFALALFESVQSHNWVMTVVFIALGILFVWADNKRS